MLLGNAPPQAVSNIDPQTGRPYVFAPSGAGTWALSGNVNSPDVQASNGGLTYGGVDSGPAQLYNFNQTARPNGAAAQNALFQSLGFTPNQNGMLTPSNDGLQQFMAQHGLTIARQGGEHGDTDTYQIFNQQGQPVGQPFTQKVDDSAFGLAVAAAAAIATAGVATAGMAGAEGGAAALDGAGGMSLAEGATPASLTGGGGGVTGASMGAANGALLNPADYAWAGQGSVSFPETLGSAGSAFPAGGAGAGEVGGGVAGAGGAGGAVGGSGVMGPGALGNGAGLLGSTLGDGTGVLGSGLTLGQVGGLVGAAGGLLGSGSGLNSATQKTQNQIDPNLKPYVYGANGLIPQANQVLQQQMATGGLNANQTVGLNSQLAVLNNPNYAAGFTQAKNLGQSLMGQGVAANPFTAGQASLTPNPQGLMGNGAQLLPGQQGLLNQRKTIMPVTGGLLGG